MTKQTVYVPYNIVTCNVQSISANDAEGARELALLSLEPLPSTLHVFTSQGGLSLLAQHMSLLYPDMAQQVPPEAVGVTLAGCQLNLDRLSASAPVSL